MANEKQPYAAATQFYQAPANLENTPAPVNQAPRHQQGVNPGFFARQLQELQEFVVEQNERYAGIDIGRDLLFRNGHNGLDVGAFDAPNDDDDTAEAEAPAFFA